MLKNLKNNALKTYFMIFEILVWKKICLFMLGIANIM